MLSRPFVDCCQTATAFPSRSIATSGDSAATDGTEMRSDGPNEPFLGRNAAPMAASSSSSSRQTATTLPELSESIRGPEPENRAGEIVSGLSSLAPVWGKATIRKPVRSAASS
jgi:hypothetical protein